MGKKEKKGMKLHGITDYIHPLFEKWKIVAKIMELIVFLIIVLKADQFIEFTWNIYNSKNEYIYIYKEDETPWGNKLYKIMELIVLLSHPIKDDLYHQVDIDI